MNDEEEGWVTDPRALDTICALNAMQVGDLVRHNKLLHIVEPETTLVRAGVFCNRGCEPAHCNAKLGYPCVGAIGAGLYINRTNLIAWKPKKVG